LIGAIFGAALGSIFKRRVMDIVAMSGGTVFGMMALMIVLLLFFRLGLKLPFNDPLGVIGWTTGSVLGAVLWMVTKLWTKRVFVEQLKKTGRSLATQYKGVAENTSIMLNGRCPL